MPNLCIVPVSQVVYVKGVEAAPTPGPQGPPGTPVSENDIVVNYSSLNAY